MLVDGWKMLVEEHLCFILCNESSSFHKFELAFILLQEYPCAIELDTSGGGLKTLSFLTSVGLGHSIESHHCLLCKSPAFNGLVTIGRLNVYHSNKGRSKSIYCVVCCFYEAAKDGEVSEKIASL